MGASQPNITRAIRAAKSKAVGLQSSSPFVLRPVTLADGFITADSSSWKEHFTTPSAMRCIPCIAPDYAHEKTIIALWLRITIFICFCPNWQFSAMRTVGDIMMKNCPHSDTSCLYQLQIQFRWARKWAAVSFMLSVQPAPGRTANALYGSVRVRTNSIIR